MIAHQWAYALVKFMHLNSFVRDALRNTKEDNTLSISINGVVREVKFRAGSPYRVREIEFEAAVDDLGLALEQRYGKTNDTDI